MRLFPKNPAPPPPALIPEAAPACTRNRSVWCALLILGLTSGSLAAQGREFESFNLITQRNIFDPNRRAPSAEPVRRQEEPPAQVRAEEFSLRGALVHDRTAVAFFDGTESQYQKALKQNDSIAGFTIALIQPHSVKLTSEEGEIELPVGMRMSKRGEESWRMLEGVGESAPSGRPESARAANARTARGRPASPTSSASSSSTRSVASEEPDEDMDEILKRMMEQRNQEINK